MSTSVYFLSIPSPKILQAHNMDTLLTQHYQFLFVESRGGVLTQRDHTAFSSKNTLNFTQNPWQAWGKGGEGKRRKRSEVTTLRITEKEKLKIISSILQRKAKLW